MERALADVVECQAWRRRPRTIAPIAAARRTRAAASGRSSMGDHDNGSIAQTVTLLGLVAHWTSPLPL
jgi:hypothetical protein